MLFSAHVLAFQYQNHSFFAFSDALFWQLREASADNWAQIISPEGIHQQIKILEVPFKWKPGFRIGIGVENSKRPWDTLFYYTWYKTKGTNQARVDSGGIYSAYLGNFFANNTSGAGVSGPYYRQAGISWDVLFNTFDLEQRYTFKINKHFLLRPFTGLKAGIIQQDINTQWQNPFNPAKDTPITTFSAASEKIKNHFWGIGPDAGLDMAWFIHTNDKNVFKLFGNFSGALMYGHWSLSDDYFNNTPISVSITNDSLNTAAFTAREQIGIEWKRVYLNTDVSARLGYEGQVWFSQMRYYSFNMGRLNHLLSLHGAVLEIAINFK